MNQPRPGVAMNVNIWYGARVAIFKLDRGSTLQRRTSSISNMAADGNQTPTSSPVHRIRLIDTIFTCFDVGWWAEAQRPAHSLSLSNPNNIFLHKMKYELCWKYLVLHYYKFYLGNYDIYKWLLR